MVETCRLIPVIVTFAIGVAVLGAIAVRWRSNSVTFGPRWRAAWCCSSPARWPARIAVIAKWLVVGRIRAVEHPLWSSFVWRNEVSDTFVETVAAPWFARAASGTPVMNLWLRALGATIGRGVWCETYWLPEADLVTLGKAATVNRGCVVQTHLFHDRIMRMDTVVLEEGSTLGPHCVALPAARLGAGATVGPASLVMRGDEVPPSTRWQGNPIAPWNAFRKKRGAGLCQKGGQGSRRVTRSKKAPRGRRHPSSTRTCRPTVTSATGYLGTNWTWNTRWPSTGCPVRRRSPR